MRSASRPNSPALIDEPFGTRTLIEVAGVGTIGARGVSTDTGDGGTKVVYEIRFEAKIPGVGRMFAATMRLGWTIGIPKALNALDKERDT